MTTDTVSRAFRTVYHLPPTVPPVPQQEMTTLAGEPLPVEFCLGTAWHAGVLIGWRHGEDGTAQVQVQFLVGGLRRTSWMQLHDLRLPEPALDAGVPTPRPATGPAPRPDLLLADRGRSRPLPSVLPQPRSPDADLSPV
jgi:hypothetical protein